MSLSNGSEVTSLWEWYTFSCIQTGPLKRRHQLKGLSINLVVGLNLKDHLSILGGEMPLDLWMTERELQNHTSFHYTYFMTVRRYKRA